MNCPNCGLRMPNDREVEFITDDGLTKFRESRCICGTRVQIPVETAILKEA